MPEPSREALEKILEDVLDFTSGIKPHFGRNELVNRVMAWATEKKEIEVCRCVEYKVHRYICSECNKPRPD